MSDSSPAPSSDDLFAALVLRYLDGDITPEGLAWLNTDLKNNRERRSLFVTLSALHGNLNELMKAVPVGREPSLLIDERPLPQEIQQSRSDSDLEKPTKVAPESDSAAAHIRGENETVRMSRPQDPVQVDESIQPKDDTIRIPLPGRNPRIVPRQEPGS